MKAASSARVGKPFKLTSHKGEVVNNATLAGKPYLAFLGFTHCPDICPTTLFELTDLMKELSPAADGFNFAFITVDPEHDTQEMLKPYMTSFDSRILALRGSLEQTEIAVKAFAEFAKKVATDGGDYRYFIRHRMNSRVHAIRAGDILKDKLRRSAGFVYRVYRL